MGHLGQEVTCSRQEVTRPGQKWPGEVAEAVQQELEVPSSGWNSSDLVWRVGGGRWMVLTLWRRGQEELPVTGGSWNLLTIRRLGGLRRIFPVFSGTSQDLPSFVLCATFKTAKMTAICCGRSNLSCSSLSIVQYNLLLNRTTPRTHVLSPSNPDGCLIHHILHSLLFRFNTAPFLVTKMVAYWLV